MENKKIYKLTAYLKKSSFLKALTYLLTGAIIGQLIGIFTSPIISRIYTPTEYGVFSQLTSLLTIISLVATLRYDEALLLPKKNSIAKILAHLSIFFSFSLSSFAFLIIIFIYYYNQSFIKSLWPEILLLPLMVFYASVINTANAWRTRENNFSFVAKIQVFRSISSSFLKIIFGVIGFHSFGLLLGLLISDFISIILNKDIFNNIFFNNIKRLIFKQSRKTKEYIDFPIYGTSQVLISSLWIQLPPLLIGKVYGSSFAGQYAMALLLIQYPIAIMQSALRQVLYPKLTSLYNNKLKLFKSTLYTTSLMYFLYLIPAVIIFFHGEIIFNFIFGDKWIMAGRISQILVVSSFISVGKTPSILLARIFKKQKEIVFLDILALILQLYIYLYLSNYKSLIEIIYCQAFITALYNSTKIIWMTYLAFNHDRELTAI